MTADVLLQRLEGVRKAGDGWSAKCPAHQDRSASLSIGEGRDGRTLVHCFAGCAVADILATVGLELADLFPERITTDDDPHARRQRRIAARQHQWAAALPVVEFESRLVLIVATDMLRGHAPDPADLERLATAVERIEQARDHFNPLNLRDMLRQAADTNGARMEAANA